jgi:NDP-sugar pyrophosphorylase family protein
VTYVEQTDLNGTAGALWAAREKLRDRFIVMMGDDLYGTDDIHAILGYEWAIGGFPAHAREVTGGITMGENSAFVAIKEDKHFVEDGYISTNLFSLKKEIFTYEPVLVPGRTEFGLPHTVLAVAQHTFVPIVPVTQWFQITTPEDLVRAEAFVKKYNHSK